MTQFVKSFIQNNKDFINDENWYAVFREWYQAAQRNFEYDDDYLKEFVECLNIVQIDCLRPSEEDRKRIIELELIPVLDRFVASSAKTIFKDSVAFVLVSNLGLNGQDIETISDKIAAGFHLHIDFEHYEKLGQ